MLGAAMCAALVAGTSADAAAREEITITAPDGARLAATVIVPDGTPPAGGWPGVVFLHGLGGTRASVLAVAEGMGLTDRYAVLAYDARGHGASEGLIGIDGPKETADAQVVFTWFRDRTDVSDTEIGGWGISYGGGALWNSLVAGTPWAALEIAESWTDLYTALMPQGVVKSGVIAGFLGGLPPAKIDPEVLAVRDAAFAGQSAAVAAFSASRSSLPRLVDIETPVFLMQGRRDFAFGIDQALQAWPRLTGPKRLWLGLHGHAPSSFPAADSPQMLAEGAQWFDLHLRGVGTVDMARPVMIAPERYTGTPARFATLPATAVLKAPLPGAASITSAGKVVRALPPLKTPIEAFGTPSVKVTATASGGWSRLVAVLSATTPSGSQIVVGGGAVPTRAGTGTYTIRMSSQVTFVPKGSRLAVTFASTSMRQNPGNLLYLDLPITAGAKIRVANASLAVPHLRQAVTR